MIGLIHLVYSKCNNPAFKINNEILDPLLCDITFLAVD